MKGLNEYIDSLIPKFEEEERNLCADSRKDEASLVKIKINICNVCKACMGVSLRAGSDVEIKEDFLTKLDNVSRPWRQSQEKAREHGDIGKASIEEIKLGMLEQIRQEFLRRCSESGI